MHIGSTVRYIGNASYSHGNYEIEVQEITEYGFRGPFISTKPNGDTFDSRTVGIGNGVGLFYWDGFISLEVIA